MPPVRTPVLAAPQQQPAQRLPFDAEFQKSLIKLLTEDPHFAHVIGSYLEPKYFENEVLAWVFGVCREHQERYHSYPSLRVIRHQCSTLDSRIRPMYEAVVDQIAQVKLTDEVWMRDKTLDFVKRSIFVRTYQETRSIYNAGKVEEAYDLMQSRMEHINKTSWEPADEGDYFENLAQRHNDRMDMDPSRASIGSGFPTVDMVLSGGLSLGEAFCWIAYAKYGKSTMLINNGLAATRLNMRKTAHLVFEGSRKQVENRYDAAFMDDVYNSIKVGIADSSKYKAAWQQAQHLKGLMKIRGFTEHWDYSVADISDVLRTWKNDGWVPEVLIIDYGDLLQGRESRYPNEREKQKAAFRDIKSLANRGYAIWTASQAQRPTEGSEDKIHQIYSRQIADCFEKVRVMDGLGSINATRDEKRNQQARLFVELYRDNAADKTIPIVFEGSKMRLYETGELGWGIPTTTSDPGRQLQAQL